MLRRRRKQRSAESGPNEVHGDAVVEMSAKEVPKPMELDEARYPRYEADTKPAPQEMPADNEGMLGGLHRDQKRPAWE